MTHTSDDNHLLECLKGIIAVPATPFNDQNLVDENALRRYIHMAIQDGVSGFLAPALAAEVYQLSQDERLNILRIILEEVKGKIPVIGSATAENRDGRQHAVEAINRLGCDGILVFIPFTDENQYKQEVLELSQQIDGFLMLQDWDFQGDGIPVSVIAELFEQIECFKSLKIEVAFAGRKYSAVLEACNHRIHVAGGWASNQMIEGLDRGVHAFMPTVLHSVYKRIYDLYQKRDRAAAVQLFNTFLPILAFTRQHPEISIHFNKRFLVRLGIFDTHNVRISGFPLDPIHIRLTDELIDSALDLYNSVREMNKT